MEARQSISKTRREYSKWVKDQTLEDFALRFTAKKARNLSIGAVSKTALGTTAFLALEALSAAATLQYGFINTLFAMFALAAAIVLTEPHCLNRPIPEVCHAWRRIKVSRHRHFTFIFFAIEGRYLHTLFHRAVQRHRRQYLSSNSRTAPSDGRPRGPLRNGVVDRESLVPSGKVAIYLHLRQREISAIPSITSSRFNTSRPAFIKSATERICRRQRSF